MDSTPPDQEASQKLIAWVRHQISQPITALRCGLETGARLPLTEHQLRQRMLELIEQVDRIVRVIEILAPPADENCHQAASE